MNKLLFFFKRPKVVVVDGNGQACAKESILQVLKPHFKIGKELLLLNADENCLFYLKRSKLPVLVITHIGEYHTDKEFFAGELNAASRSKELAKALPKHGFLVLNFDDETVRNIKNSTSARSLTFGFGARSEIQATDTILTHSPDRGTNFKINYQGNTVPIWLEKTFGKEQIYSALAAAAVGNFLGLNLVEISGSLKNYQSLPGKMRLITGIKNSLILDDSAGASVFSMMEALDILGKIDLEQGRKIAVLGDILGVGEYTAETHEVIGEKAAKTANLLFTVGNRAGFFAEGALKKGMAKDKILKFRRAEEAGLALQKEIKPGDLILIDGSKEMSMIEIVDEIKAGPIV